MKLICILISFDNFISLTLRKSDQIMWPPQKYLCKMMFLLSFKLVIYVLRKFLFSKMFFLKSTFFRILSSAQSVTDAASRNTRLSSCFERSEWFAQMQSAKGFSEARASILLSPSYLTSKTFCQSRTFRLKISEIYFKYLTSMYCLPSINGICNLC